MRTSQLVGSAGYCILCGSTSDPVVVHEANYVGRSCRCGIVYIAAAVVATAVARRQVRNVLADRGLGPVTSVMVGPAPANPFAGTVVVATPDAYHLGEWRWFAEPRLQMRSQPIERRANDPIAAM